MIDNYEYRLYEVPPEELGEFLKNGDFDALNVTVPYKKAVIPYLSSMTDRAAAIGSVNVITRDADGGLVGDNADYGGFMSLVKKSGIRVKEEKVLVLGSGGASTTVREMCKRDRIYEIRKTVFARGHSGVQVYSHRTLREDNRMRRRILSKKSR